MHQLLRQNQVRYLDVKPYIRTFSRNNPTELGEWAKEEGGLFEPGTLIFLLEPAKRPPGMSSFARGQQPAEVAQDAFRVKDMCVVVDKIEGKCWVLAISPSAFELRFIDTLFREKSQKAFLEGLDFNYLAAQPRPPLNQAKLKELRSLSTLYSKSGSRRTVAQDGSGPDEPAKAMLAFLGADLSASVGKQVMELGSICNMIFAPESVQENKLQSMVKSCFTPILASDKLKTPPNVATKQVLESQAQMNEEVSLLTQAYLESEAKEAGDYIASQPDIVQDRNPAAPTPKETEEFKKLDAPSPEPPPGFDIGAFSPQPSKELLAGQPASLDAAPDIPMILTGEHQVVTVGDTKNGQSQKVPSLPAWYMTTHDVGEMNQVAIRRTQISPSMPEGLDKLETELSYDALPVVDTRFRESQETPEPVNPAAIPPAEAAKPTFSEQFRADYDKGQAGQAAFPSVSNLFETAAPFIQEEPQEPVAWPTSDSTSAETGESTEAPRDFVDSIFQEGGARSSLETNPDARESQIERRRKKPVQPGDWQPLSTVREPEKEDWSKDEPKGAAEAARPTMDLPVESNLFDKLAGQTSDELGQIIDQPPGWGADESSPGGVPTNLKDMLTVDSAVFSTAQPNAESGPAFVESVLSEISPSETAGPADATNSSASDADESPDPWTKLPTKSDDKPVESTGWQPPDSLDEVVPAAQGAAGWSALSSESAAAEPAALQSASEEAKNPEDQENYKELAKALNGLMDSEGVEIPAPVAAPPEDVRPVDPEVPPVETPEEGDIGPTAPVEESVPLVSPTPDAEPTAETADLTSLEEATIGGASHEAPPAPAIASDSLFPRRSVIEDDEPSPPPLSSRAGGSLFPTPTSSQAESLFPRPAELVEEAPEIVPDAVPSQLESAANPPFTREGPEATTVEPILGDLDLPPRAVDGVIEEPLANGAVSSPSAERAEPVNPAAMEPLNPALIDVPQAPTAADELIDESVLASVEKVESVELPPVVDAEPVQPESITTDSYLSEVEPQVMPAQETDLSDSVIDKVLDLAEAEPTKEADEILPTDDAQGREMTQDLDKAILQKFNRGDKTLPQSVADELRFAPEEEAVAQAPLTVPPPVEQPAPLLSEATLEIEQASIGDDSAENAYTISSVTAPIITPPPPEVAPYIPAGLADRQPIIPPAPRKDEQSLLSGADLTEDSVAPLSDLPESIEDSGVFLTEKPQEKSVAVPAPQRPNQPAMEPKLVISESTRFMARLNQRLSEAEKKLSNRCDQSRDRLIRELEALVDEARKIERQNELTTGGLTEKLIANLVKVTADVKARIAKSATESREALRDVIQSAEESVSELNSELTQELDSIEEKFKADSDVLTDKTRAALNQHAQDRITEYNRKVDEIASALESVYKHHLGVMLTRFSKFETRLTEEVNAIISSLDRNVASMNVEIDGSWDRASEKLTSSQTEFANSVSFLVHSCKAEIKQVHLDAYASTVFPRLLENKDIFRAMLADMKRNFEEQSDKIRKQQVEGLSSTIDKARLELNTVTRESLSTIESVGKGQQFGLEELFNSTSKRLEDIIDIVESRLKTAKQEIVNNDEACMKASEASRVEDEPAFAKEKQQAISALNDCRTKADNTLETSISSSCLNLEHFSEELQEDLAKQRADWTSQVRLTADESLMRVKQAIQDAFQSIETEKEKYME